MLGVGLTMLLVSAGQNLIGLVILAAFLLRIVRSGTIAELEGYLWVLTYLEFSNPDRDLSQRLLTVSGILTLALAGPLISTQGPLWGTFYPVPLPSLRELAEYWLNDLKKLWRWGQVLAGDESFRQVMRFVIRFLIRLFLDDK